jgi:hypothetical protein
MVEFNEILDKKRISKEEKKHLSRLIIDQALKLIEKDGKFIETKNIETKPKGVKKGKLDIQLTTPFNKLEGTNYLVDIWFDGKGKVFSARWTNPKDVDVVNLKRGEWITILMT